jgi:hypothetical protein
MGLKQSKISSKRGNASINRECHQQVPQMISLQRVVSMTINAHILPRKEQPFNFRKDDSLRLALHLIFCL